MKSRETPSYYYALIGGDSSQEDGISRDSKEEEVSLIDIDWYIVVSIQEIFLRISSNKRYLCTVPHKREINIVPT